MTGGSLLPDPDGITDSCGVNSPELLVEASVCSSEAFINLPVPWQLRRVATPVHVFAVFGPLVRRQR